MLGNTNEIKKTYETSTIAELNNGIILSRYDKTRAKEQGYQSEAELEENLIENLLSQGYDRLDAKTNEALYANLKKQIERLNKVSFTDEEWARFLVEYIDAPSDGMIEKTRKIQVDHVYDFLFDDGSRQNISIIDKKDIHNNIVQVANQVHGVGPHNNRYDVSIFVNGLPLVHVELKKRGTSMYNAFEQIHRYVEDSFNEGSSLYKYVQIFVISNGTFTRYFANTTAKDKNNYEFTCEWADARNKAIRDLEDFTRTFFEKRVLLELLTKYCVFDTNNTLLVMRPYQIAATERILWKIKSGYESKKYGKVEGGGFVWHTTGSGKTLTSFKAARLATELPFIDKVFFIVDRRDLDYQTMKEYKRFDPDSVSGSKDTKALAKCIAKDSNRIIVTTIQKMNEFVKKNPSNPVYDKQCVLIYDECHRSQFGDAQKNIRRRFKKYYQFGFTGTPIFAENTIAGDTTAGVFGAQLHSYVITDAIRDEKVLKFKVDYNNISPEFKDAEKDLSEKEMDKMKSKMLLHPDRIEEITKYILNVFNKKTHRNEHHTLRNQRINGFNAMFAVDSIDAAKLYYNEFKKQQAHLPEEERLRVATIFSYSQNESPSSLGEIVDEEFNVSALGSSAKEFLNYAIDDYNKCFNTNFSTDNAEFQNYYQNLSKRVKDGEVDLLIVVGMFLTGFDAPRLNTLFVDKNLKYHGLIQAYSRTNRILNKVKSFGNIVCFRDLEEATKDAIKVFGDKNSVNVILEKSFDEYIHGFKDEDSGEVKRGYIEICEELKERFPDPSEIVFDADKKDFVKLFNDYLAADNILKNFDEYEEFDKIFSEREVQDMRSVYLAIREGKGRGGNPPDGSNENEVDFSNVEFHIDLIKTDEINLEYILALILEKTKDNENIENIKAEVRRVIRSSIDTRSKEDIVIKYINNTDLKRLKTNNDILESFYSFAKAEKIKSINDLIVEENLNENAKRFIEKSISRGFAENNGDELDGIIPPTSRRKGAREKKKEEVLFKIQNLVDVFVGL